MKRIFYLFAISALLCGCAPFNLFNSQVKFAEVFVADFFENDTISLKVADSMLIQDAVVDSEPSTGLTGWSAELIKLKDDLIRVRLHYPTGEVRHIYVKQNIPKTLKIEVWFNGKYQSFKFDLNKGIYLLLDKNDDKISIRQTPTIPEFH